MLNPIPLKGQPERISTIARTSINEPVEIKVTSIQTIDDPSKGYLVVLIPASSRAPHMVEVKGDNRFYGRTASGNAILTQNEVERLYQRRQRQAVDLNELIAQEIELAPIPPQSDLGYLHIVVRPVFHKQDFFQGIEASKKLSDILNICIDKAKALSLYDNHSYAPDFNYPQRWVYRTDGLSAQLGDRGNTPNMTLQLTVDNSGTLHLFCGRAADTETTNFYLFPSIIIGNTIRFFAFTNYLYEEIGYWGKMNVGLAITNLSGARMYTKNHGYMSMLQPYQQPQYTQGYQTLSFDSEKHRKSVAKRLLMPLFRVLSQGQYDPFGELL